MTTGDTEQNNPQQKKAPVEVMEVVVDMVAVEVALSPVEVVEVHTTVLVTGFQL
jgi:hypothetical protein